MKKLCFLLIIPFLSLGQTPCLDAVANATGLVGEFIPQCEDDGSFSPMQCWGSTGYCWCVDENGEEIAGTSLGPGEGIPSCDQQGDSLSVLFIGNSYTSSNNLPGIIATIANSLDDFVYIETNLVPASTLQSHVNNPISNNLIMNGGWDYVVLQEQSQYPSFPIWQVEQDVFPYATELSQLISDYNNCGETVFFMTWGRENGDVSNCSNWPPVCTYEGMDDLLQERYLTMGNDNGALVCPVGAVWRYLREGEYDLDLYAEDGSHPSLVGSYVAGLSFYTTLFQKDPSEISLNSNWDILESEIEIIKEAVKIVVYDNLSDWNINSSDIDNDGICNNADNCPEDYNPSQEDFDDNGVGDACDGIGVSEIIKKKKLIKKTDIMGRESVIKGLYLEIYDDGSVEKKYFLQ